MNIKLTMWGQPQLLKVEFEMQPMEPAANEQTRAYNMFMKEKQRIISNIENAINEYLDTDNALNIIKPYKFYVAKTNSDTRKIFILCDNKNDPDNDFVIILEDEEIYMIGYKDEF